MPTRRKPVPFPRVSSADPPCLPAACRRALFHGHQVAHHEALGSGPLPARRLYTVPAVVACRQGRRPEGGAWGGGEGLVAVPDGGGGAGWWRLRGMRVAGTAAVAERNAARASSAPPQPSREACAHAGSRPLQTRCSTRGRRSLRSSSSFPPSSLAPRRVSALTSPSFHPPTVSPTEASIHRTLSRARRFYPPVPRRSASVPSAPMRRPSRSLAQSCAPYVPSTRTRS